MQMNLQETDFGDVLGTESNFSPTVLEGIALGKLVNEFKYLEAQAVEPLYSFLSFIKVEYMIDNVCLLLRGSLSGRDINELIAQCHPLGAFSESTMRSIAAIDHARGYTELYETVLVDTPVGVYFQRYLDDAASRMAAAADMKNVLEEVQIEMLKQNLMKLFLEDFYSFCENLGGDTATLMCEILKTRADRNAILLTLFSFGSNIKDERRVLYPSIGHLYPAGTELMCLADEEAKLLDAVRSVSAYTKIVDKFMNAGPDDSSIDDDFFRHEVMNFELAFESQSHMASFYAYVKLKEQEIRNLVWIAECILQRRKDKISNYVPLFSKSAEWRCDSTRKLA